MQRRIVFVAGLIVAVISTCIFAAGPQTAASTESLPTLKQVAAEYKAQLNLTDNQSAKLHDLIQGEMARVTPLVEKFGAINFDSVVDLLGEVKSIKSQFIPQMSAILTPEQKTKLASMPKNKDFYAPLVAGWMAEARTKKLNTKLHLTDQQVPQVRNILLTEFQDGINIVSGLTTATDQKKQVIMDAILDLRGTMRTRDRELAKILTPDQQAAMQKYKKETEEAAAAAQTKP
ncbi:MAG TPA: hypothetical protein VFG11_11420 [Acidobacteriota bacterium]|nr:hypothetical protein [Acidobacteriota bacterium]